MKIKLHHVLLTLSLAIVAPAGLLSVQAQDASYPNIDAYESDNDRELEKGTYTAGEADPLVNSKLIHTQAAKDSATSRSATIKTTKAQPEAQKNSAKPASQDDDSILSFNFLYYIFEKYKMQDIVD